jgi:hypothetical protein
VKKKLVNRVQVTYRAAYGYVTGVLRDGEHIPLCRLRYGGSAYSFGFALYSAAHDSYQDAILRTGVPAGTPQEALDYRLHDPPHRVAQP